MLRPPPRATRLATLFPSKALVRADDFRARTLIFSAAHYADSFIFTSSADEFLNSGGKEFCLKFASIFDRHSPNRFSAIPYNNDGERLIMIGERTKEDLEHSQEIDQIGRANV